MLSRVAESIYWFSRYIERAENVARFIDVTYNVTLGELDPVDERWNALLYTAADRDAFAERYGKVSREDVLRFLCFDEENENSILSCVSKTRENARTVREIISEVVWEQLNKFYLMVRSDAACKAWLAQPQEFCERVRLASHLLVGAMAGTMPYDEAWHFSRLGRMIERADQTSRIVDVQYNALLPEYGNEDSIIDVVRWSALLRSTSSLAAYRRAYGKIDPERIAMLLILDRRFPRSMHFGVMKAQESLREITGSRPGTFVNSSEQLIGRLRSRLDYADLADVLDGGLHEFIDEFQTQLNEIGRAVYDDFFRRDRYVQTQNSASSNVEVEPRAATAK